MKKLFQSRNAAAVIILRIPIMKHPIESEKELKNGEI